MFLRNYWYVAAYDHEINAQAARPHDSGRAHRPLPHGGWRARGAGGPLRPSPSAAVHGQAASAIRCNATIMACAIDCSGRCVQVPGQDTVPPGASVKSYPVVERYHWLWIWMGDPALADPADITDFHWLDDRNWGAKRAIPACQIQLAAHRRQSARSHASRLRSRDHDRQFGSRR